MIKRAILLSFSQTRFISVTKLEYPSANQTVCCPQCKSVYYCSQECQHASCKLHEKVCKQISVKLAEKELYPREVVPEHDLKEADDKMTYDGD